jgi:hypothetical protein
MSWLGSLFGAKAPATNSAAVGAAAPTEANLLKKATNANVAKAKEAAEANKRATDPQNTVVTVAPETTQGGGRRKTKGKKAKKANAKKDKKSRKAKNKKRSTRK